MYNYVITGLRVSSEFKLRTAVPVGAASADADVRITMRDQIATPANLSFENEWIAAGNRDFLFRPQKGLSFRIRDGHEISISKAANVSDSDVNLFLVGSAWGVLCHQRRLLPLHCSAVECGARSFAFTGPSGAGKSTLAAGLSKRGYLHLCDDVCIVDAMADEVALLPMPKGLKLWRDATDALGLERGEAVSSNHQPDKFHVCLPQSPDKIAPKIAALYVLAKAGGAAPSISRLRGSAHVQELFSSIYRIEWLGLLRDNGEVFIQIAALAKKMKLFRFSRPKDMTRFDEGLDLLEVHMAKIAAREHERQ